MQPEEEKLLADVAMKVSVYGADEAWGKILKYIKKLQFENTVLREKLLPCKVGDYVYDITNGEAYKTRVLEWRVFNSGNIGCRTVSSFPMLEEFGTRILLTKEAAEHKLAEKRTDD